MTEIRLDGTILYRKILSVKPERSKMKLHMDLPWGGHLRIEREPMEPGKFYALVALAAGVLVVVLFLTPVVVKHM